MSRQTRAFHAWNQTRIVHRGHCHASRDLAPPVTTEQARAALARPDAAPCGICRPDRPLRAAASARRRLPLGLLVVSHTHLRFSRAVRVLRPLACTEPVWYSCRSQASPPLLRWSDQRAPCHRPLVLSWRWWPNWPPRPTSRRPADRARPAAARSGHPPVTMPNPGRPLMVQFAHWVSPSGWCPRW
jgi:hypothetical protein